VSGRVGRRSSTHLAAVLVAIALSAAIPFSVAQRASGARESSASGSVDHVLGISYFKAGTTRTTIGGRGLYAEIPSLMFSFEIDFRSDHSDYLPTSETVRVSLPAGLSWGPQAATPRTAPIGNSHNPGDWSFTATGEACDVRERIATCRADGVPGGTQLFGWVFDVIAAAPGIYKLTGQVVPPADGRNSPALGGDAPTKAVLVVVVGKRSGPVSVGKVELSRPRPSYVVAVVQISQGGEPVQANADVTTSSGRAMSGGMCTWSFLSDPTHKVGAGQAWVHERGKVRCVAVFNNSRYMGKTLVGGLAFTVGETKVKRTFSVRVGKGTSLSSPKGAVIKER